MISVLLPVYEFCWIGAHIRHPHLSAFPRRLETTRSRHSTQRLVKLFIQKMALTPNWVKATSTDTRITIVQRSRYFVFNFSQSYKENSVSTVLHVKSASNNMGWNSRLNKNLILSPSLSHRELFLVSHDLQFSRTARAKLFKKPESLGSRNLGLMSPFSIFLYRVRGRRRKMLYIMLIAKRKKNGLGARNVTRFA